MTVFDYTTEFSTILDQKYAAESKCDALYRSNPQVTFLSGNTIKLPHIAVSGYKDHNRGNIGFNAGTVTNDWVPMQLSFDRDIEHFIDPMDVQETKEAVSIANIERVFEEEQAIPERDAYTFSKLYTDYTDKFSQNADTTVLSVSNVLGVFDAFMADMDDAGVPEEGRIMYVTAAAKKLLKNAEGISRQLDVTGRASDINRKVHSLDDVEIVTIPSIRFKTAYDFTDGFAPRQAVAAVEADPTNNIEAVAAVESAKQINMILVHPSCVVARMVYAYAKLFTPGHDTRAADKYVFQSRRYLDAFLLEHKLDGFKVNVAAA